MSNNFFEKLFQKKNNAVIYIILIIGVVFMLLIGTGKPSKKAQTQKQEQTVYSEEARLENIISQIQGAGKVSVMITYHEGTEKSLAYDTKKTENQKESDGTKSSEETIDKQAVLSSGSPMVVKEVYPKVKGVVVTAEGANDARVKNNISEAVQTSLDVPAHKVCILAKN
jgi:stage III sporulation protein AG